MLMTLKANHCRPYFMSKMPVKSPNIYISSKGGIYVTLKR